MSVDEITNGIVDTMSDSGGVDYLLLNTDIDIINKLGSFILGMGLGLILLIFPIIVLLEVMYLNFPIFREGVGKLMYSGKGYVQKVIKFSLRDATKAYEEANTVVTGTSANWIYFKIKIKAIVLVIFIVVLLVNGSGFVVNIIYRLVKGIIDLITIQM